MDTKSLLHQLRWAEHEAVKVDDYDRAALFDLLHEWVESVEHRLATATDATGREGGT